MATSEGSTLRRRLTLGGMAALVVAVVASAAVDRALVLAEVAAPLRFALSTAVLLVGAVAPLLASLERWVIRPLEALDEVHRQSKAGRDPSLPEAALARMPLEFRKAVQRQLELLDTMQRTNKRLSAQVSRRTAVLQAMVEASDAVLTASDAELGGRLVQGLRPIAGETLPALLLPTGRGLELHIAHAVQVDPVRMEAIEESLERELGGGHELTVHWHPAPSLHTERISGLRVLFRAPVEPEPGAVLLLTHRPADFEVSTVSVRSTLRSLADQLSVRLAR